MTTNANYNYKFECEKKKFRFNFGERSLEWCDHDHKSLCFYYTLNFILQSITATVGKASSSSAGAASGTSASKTFLHDKPPPVCWQFSFSHIIEISNWIPSIYMIEFQAKEHFDAWELKKSILNTLFQAVKAITGGVTAIKGQLIKGSGYALSHGGKVLQFIK